MAKAQLDGAGRRTCHRSRSQYSDTRSRELPQGAFTELRRAPPTTARAAARTAAGNRPWRNAAVPAANRLDPGLRLGRRAHPRRFAGPPCGDHRAGGPQDDHQRAELGRQRVHGGFRGFQFAHLAEQSRRAVQSARRGERHDRLCEPGRQALRIGRAHRGTDGAAARLASGPKSISWWTASRFRAVCSISGFSFFTMPRP